MKRLTTKHEEIRENKKRASGLQTFKAIKIISLLLCMMFLFTMLAACGNGEEDDVLLGEADESASDGAMFGEGSDEEEPEHPSQDFSERMAANLEEAMTTFGRNDVMIRSGDQYVTWSEMYVFIFSMVANLTGFFESPVDWSEVIDDTDGETTMADMVLNLATENAIVFLSYRYGAASVGVSLSQDDLDDINANMQGIIEFYGGFEELSTALREEYGFYDYEAFENMVMTESLVGAVMRELYGEFGANLSDEVAADFAERQNFMMAKHILVMSADNENARNDIDEIYNRLRPRASDADFEDFFTEMMLEYSEDPGSIRNPEGYLFQPWDMVEPFSVAAMDLSPGEMSDIVETTHGYHIILRVPTNLDGVPISVANMGQTHTIRQLAAGENFEGTVSEWREQMNIEFSALHDSISIARMFAWLGI